MLRFFPAGLNSSVTTSAHGDGVSPDVFFVFDKDKDGYFEEEEMKLIIAILYRLDPNDRLKGNEYRSWLKVEIGEDGRIEPEEFIEINRTYPILFYPAFRLLQSMILHTPGRSIGRAHV